MPFRNVRALTISAAFAAALALAGCNGESMVGLGDNAKANRPIPDRLLADMQTKDMDPQSPMLVRVFKQEAELEVWKQNRSGRFELLKTYPICRWSGDLGPKVREGDRQAPEGFYNITPAQMNPQSAYFLSFNTGYPNAFDRALGRTGSELMVHGDCSSRGCYAMTDEQISEIYAMGREAFFGGQRSFQFQAYPFRMTAKNMARHRNNPNLPFWKMLKDGYDHFEVTHLEPKVDVCEKHYVFDAQQPANSSKPLRFDPAGKCPAYELAPDIADAVKAKSDQDDAETAQLVARNEPTAPMRRGIDGGMNAVFAAKLPDGQTGLSDNKSFTFASSSSYNDVPATLPYSINPPRAPDQAPVTASLPAGDGTPPTAPAAATPSAARVAVTEAPKSDGFFSGLARKMGLGRKAEPETVAAAPAQKPKVAEIKPAPAAKPAAPRSEAVQATLKPAVQDTSRSDTATGALPGSQPVVSSNSFDSRFSAMR